MSFGSPAGDYVETSLDLNRFLIAHPVATFFMRMQGQELQSQGIFEGDILVVDRAVTPVSGHLVVVETDCELKVIPFPKTPQVEILSLFGVVTSVIRRL